MKALELCFHTILLFFVESVPCKIALQSLKCWSHKKKNIVSNYLVGWWLRTRNEGHSTPLLDNFTCKITAILVTNNLYHPHAGPQQNNSKQMYLFKTCSSPSGWKASSVVRLTSSPIVKYP